ncbi:MAG: hypothetical protein KKA07_03405 [Bacteroidetes bacterium]|nr:hypothetical protein [Bacteroidota bacterium]MBU1718099.1 hypothetical protein [Bacteroidota bacterium]
MKKTISIFRRVFRNHSLMIIYYLMLFFLTLGVYVKSGTQFLDEMFIYILSFTLFYFLFQMLLKRTSVIVWIRKILRVDNLIVPDISKFSLIMIASIVAFIVFHFFYLGCIPVLKAWHNDNSDNIMMFRRSLTEDSNILINYLSSFLLKAMIPFYVLYLFIAGKRSIYVIFMLVAVCYSVSLLQKSFILTALIPIIIYATWKRKFLHAALAIAIICVSWVFLVFAANPELRGVPDKASSVPIAMQEAAPLSASNSAKLTIVSLAQRAVLKPGEIVAEWFRLIPSEYPYLKGHGYNFLRPINSGHYVDYSTELYKSIFPIYYKRGLRGAVNVASFMYDYANFGKLGLFYSGFSLALVFVVVLRVFRKAELPIIVAVNIYSVLVLSSSALTTLLFSGGWGIIILLYVLHSKNFESISKKAE